MLELDVILSKDNQVIVTHEDSLLRLTGKDLNISSLNYNELPSYSTQFFSHFLENSYTCDKEYSFTTLSQVFENCFSNYISIDIKNPTIETITEVKKLIDKYQRHDKTVKNIQIVGNSSEKFNKIIRNQIPAALYFMSMEKVLFLYFAYAFGFIGLVPIKENCMCLPIMTKEFEKLKYSEISYFKAFL